MKWPVPAEWEPLNRKLGLVLLGYDPVAAATLRGGSGDLASDITEDPSDCRVPFFFAASSWSAWRERPFFHAYV